MGDQIFDRISVKLSIKVPKNARGFRVDFDFWSGEWPDYVCSKFNDGFLIILKISAFNNGKPENIAFDAQGGPLSVNNGFFDRCTASTQTGCRGEPPSSGPRRARADRVSSKARAFLPTGTYCGEQARHGRRSHRLADDEGAGVAR